MFSHRARETGDIHPDKRASPKDAWEKGSTGEAILDAYDALGSLEKR